MAFDSLRAAGVEVEAVTAEPGGEDAVSTRLAEKKIEGLKFPVRSDPEHALVVEGAGDIYTFSTRNWDVTGPYEMYQPALVVLKGDDVLKECTWSWKTMGIVDGQSMQKVKTEDWDPPLRDVPLVCMRPLIDDILPAIQEQRAVKLTAAMMFN